MPWHYSEADIEELRKIADECDYDCATIAARVFVAVDTVIKWGTKGWLTPGGEKLKTVKARRHKQRIREAIERCNGNYDAAAKELSLSPRTLRANSKWYGITPEIHIAAVQPKRCVMCFREFRNVHPQTRTCSKECHDARETQQSRMRYARANGLEYNPFGPIRPRDTMYTRYQDAIWKSFGNVARAAKIIGCSVANMHANVSRWGLRDYVEKARRSRLDPERLRELLEEHGWNIGRACKAINRNDDWVRRMALAAGDVGIVENAPCLECGTMCPRKGKRQSTCSEACMITRERRQSAQRRDRHRARTT